MTLAPLVALAVLAVAVLALAVVAILVQPSWRSQQTSRRCDDVDEADDQAGGGIYRLGATALFLRMSPLSMCGYLYGFYLYFY